MRSVVISLALLTAMVGANPTRLKREEIAAPPEQAKSDPSSLLELPEPGPIEETEIVDGVSVPAKIVAESADAPPPRESPAAIGQSSTRKSTPPPAREDSGSAETVEGTTPFNIFETYPVQETVEVCNEKNAAGVSKIYCSGRLLAAVNLHHIFPDSKTFVDRPIKRNRTQDDVMTDFEQRFPRDEEIDPEQLRAFVEQHFDQEGHELEKCEVPDWSPTPMAFKSIKDEEMKRFAHSLNDIWKGLCRKIKSEVHDEPERFSLLYVPNNFIAPGGRFREFYYWDTYWIVKGLLASGMYETTRGMIENLGKIVEKFGFIPNGGRVYYLKRSQPPLLTAMVYEYYEATRNKTFLRQMMPLLEQEFDFWRDNRKINVDVNGVNHTMFQYRTEANVPRPESYREDASMALIFPSKGRQQAFYRDVGSAAESGWDFSTRWFADHKSMITIQTTDIVPVDLNAFLCYNLNILSFFYGQLGNFSMERSRLNDYNAFKTAFRQVFYKPEEKGWYDYNLKNGQHNTDFFPSIAIPLFTGCYDQLSMTQASDLLEKMTEMGALKWKGGIPTSLANQTQEQWDFPNGWSPLNHMVIEGMRKSDNPKLEQTAYDLAKRWVNNNLQVFKLDNAMWEKYNVQTNEHRGGGGEYEVQAGFGWTNGVVLDLLVTYGDRLTEDDDSASDSAPSSSSSPKQEPTTSSPPAIGSAMPIVSHRSTTASSSSPALFHLVLATIVASVVSGWW